MADEEGPVSDEDALTAYHVASESPPEPVDVVVRPKPTLREGEAESPESGEIVQPTVEPPGKRQGRKPSEPYDVPTSGKFWMHDDREGSDEEAPR